MCAISHCMQAYEIKGVLVNQMKISTNKNFLLYINGTGTSDGVEGGTAIIYRHISLICGLLWP